MHKEANKAELLEEAELFKTYWEEYELLKMDVQEGSEWYLISCEWLARWKDYVGFEATDTSPDTPMNSTHPGMILNEDIIEDVENKLIDRRRPHLNHNLKENLREEDHYHILNEKVWNFLYTRYGGVEVKRFGVKREDDSEE